MKKHNFVISLITCSLLMMTSCQCNRNQTTADIDGSLDPVSNNETVTDDLNKSKTILYTLPAPIEIAALIKESGVRYDNALLNDLSNTNKYTTNLKMALNLGMYSTDMSFASIFNQSQKTVDYLSSIKVLIDKLGIVQVIDDKTIHQLEEKKATKDEMLNIISEVYMNANQFLNENNRKNIAVMVLVGGWTEGVYIALNLMNTTEKNNQKLTERVIAQKLALETVISIIDSNNSDDDEDLTYLKFKMMEIKQIFDEVRIELVDKVSAETDAEEKITYIKANCSSEISPDIFEILLYKVNEVRAEFASNN